MLSPEEIAFQSKLKAIQAMQAKLGKGVLNLQQELYLQMVDSFFDKLETSAGRITSSRGNITLLQAIDKIFERFTLSKHLPVIQSFASDMLSVINLNDTYFEFFKDEARGKAFSAIKGEVREFTKLNLGLKNKTEFIPKGFFDKFVKDEAVANKLKQTTLKAISGGTGLQEYKAQVKDLLQGTPGKTTGAFEQYYNTYAFDQYQKTDRLSGKLYADALKMDTLLYAGNIIETSRPFCIARANKVFTREEVEKFGTSKDKFGGYSNKLTGQFNGKPKDYNPIIDLGGYNCRHSGQWISKRMAERLRPDLKGK